MDIEMKSSFVFLILFLSSIVCNIRPVDGEDDDMAATAPPDDSVTLKAAESDSELRAPSGEEKSSNSDSELKESAGEGNDSELKESSGEENSNDNDSQLKESEEEGGDKELQAPSKDTSVEVDVELKASKKGAKNSGPPNPGDREDGEEGDSGPVTESLKETIKKAKSFREKYSIFKRRTKIYVKDKAQKVKDWILHFDLSKLDVRNLTQFLPFYNDYKKLFNKKYSSNKERKVRIGYFKSAIEKIKEHNKNLKARYQKGINELSDMSFSEILKQKLGFKNTEDDKVLKAAEAVPEVSDLPEEWDWRKFGITTEPRNQGKCGSCWSFAAAAVLETHNMKRQISEGKFDPQKIIYVSEQQLIDCSGEFGTVGCDGGMPQQAFKYVAQAKAMNSVKSYPYTGKKDTKCKADEAKKEDVKVEVGKRLKTGADEDLIKAIYNFGPVAIAIHVTKDMASYKTGIFDDAKCNAKKVNHAVVAVGYTKEFVIVRNSWGAKWGEKGYIRVSRKKINNCGISQQGYYPVVPDAVETGKMKDKLIEIS